MSYPQFQAASDYLGAIADEDYVKALPSNSYEDRGGAVLDGPEAGYKVTYTQADAEAVFVFMLSRFYLIFFSYKIIRAKIESIKTIFSALISLILTVHPVV